MTNDILNIDEFEVNSEWLHQKHRSKDHTSEITDAELDAHDQAECENGEQDLPHHSHIFMLGGESYRLKQKAGR